MNGLKRDTNNSTLSPGSVGANFVVMVPCFQAVGPLTPQRPLPEDGARGRKVSCRWSLIAFALLLFSIPLHADEPKNQLPKKQHKDSDAPFLSPAEAVAKMAIPEGFEVSVFASEPDIAEPIAFCFDDRGRMWVVENFNYQTRKKHTDDPVSRIQILEDTNGDGVYDKKKTFTDKLTFTSGIACGFGGVFVGSPPNFSFIPDVDGDDVPDGPPEILLDGWGIDDRHETLNSFIWGPDGWLYGCHGVFTQSNVGKPGDEAAKRQFIDAGIWRYHPTRKTFEIFARGLSNPWGFDFNDHGQGFATCCVIPHLFHVVQGGTYHIQSNKHVNPYVYDDIKTIRDHVHLSAHGGARFYLADTFPKQFRDRLVMCNIHEHAVLTDYMVPKGSSFIGKHGDDFMPTNDLAWVGFSVETGPEGGVYILDWHDQDICGNAVKFPNSGRVYRIMPKGAKVSPQPNLGKLSDAELVGLQMHSNDWYVRQARTLLQSRAASGKLDRALVHSGLNKIFAAAPNAAKRLRALWALQVTGGITRDRLGELLSHENEHIRAWAIQFLCDPSEINAFQPEKEASWKLEEKYRTQFVNMAKTDASQVVRLYLASAIQRLPFAERWPILEGLVSHAEDASDNNLPRMYWFALEPMVPAHARQSLRVAIAGKIPALQEFVARRLATGNAKTRAINQVQQAEEWDRIIQTMAKGFRVNDVGEGGVVRHEVFRNQSAVQTHPLDRKRPCVLGNNRVDVPEGKKTYLKMRVSHHPHGDWQLRVLSEGEVLDDRIVSASTVGQDEWLDVSVDLSKFAGRRIQLSIENRANNWKNEWAYWNKVEIVTE
jgi:putative membrane-bound dehydrogenase-like protein